MGAIQELWPAESPRFPAALRFASIVWIAFGSLWVLSGVANIIMAFTPRDGKTDPGGAVCAICVGGLFGVAFLMVGIQTLNGKARDTLGNSIGSIVFGLIYAGFGIIMLMGGTIGRGRVEGSELAIVAGCIGLFAGIGLLAAGLLALRGRFRYKAWRRFQGAD